MLSSRTRGLTIALVATALSIVGMSGVNAKVPDQPQKGIAPLCLLGAPAAECEDGPVS
jgi:hypothetical protein